MGDGENSSKHSAKKVEQREITKEEEESSIQRYSEFQNSLVQDINMKNAILEEEQLKSKMRNGSDFVSKYGMPSKFELCLDTLTKINNDLDIIGGTIPTPPPPAPKDPPKQV